MSFKSIRTIASMIVGVLLVIAYIIYATGAQAPAPDNLQAWAKAQLIFIGIGVAGVLLTMILLHIALAISTAVKEREKDTQALERIIESTTLDDEMDKLISQKAARVSQFFLGLGVIAFLLLLAFQGSMLFALHVLLGSFFCGNLIEGCLSVYLYERGVSNA